eukprot:Selendium_serpulae@DN6372_c0_g1_i15.p1
MKRRGGLILLLAASLATASASGYGGYGGYEPEPYHEEETYGYGHEIDHHEEPYGYGHKVDHGYGHRVDHGYGHEEHGYEPKHSYGHEPAHGYAPKCKDGFYGQCKKDKWGNCIQPAIVGVWELTEHEADDYTDSRFLVQIDEYDFCKQSGNYRVTNGKGLTESVTYGTYIWTEPKYYKMVDYGYTYGYKYPYPINGSVVWRNDFKIIGYGNDKAKSVKPVIGITRDLYGKVVSKIVTSNKYRKLKGPHEGIEY